MKPDRPLIPRESSAWAHRIRYALEKLWAGNQSEMARDLACSQALISRVIAGNRTPGLKLLEALAAHPSIDERWLMTGVGNLLVREGPGGVPPTAFLPISTQLLPGPPEEHRHLLSGAYRPVASPDLGEARYWHCLESGQLADQGLHAGEWLLMDADGSWLQRPEILIGQPCVVREGHRAKPALAIRLLRYDPELKPAGKYVVDLLAPASQEPKIAPSTRKSRNIRIRNETKMAEGKARKVVSASSKMANLVPLTMIVAVAVKSERQWP